MEAIMCEHCKSVMGLVKETPRWKLYRCYSCRHVTGQINRELKGLEFEDATREMDDHAGSVMRGELGDIRDRLQRMSPEELGEFFEGKDKPSK
jgi:hypothetical protein